MNYYIQGNKDRAEEIRATFEKLRCDTTGWKFNVEGGFYYTHDGKIDLAHDKFLINLIKTHPDYKELELPIQPKFNVGDWLVYKNGNCFAGGLREVQVVKVKDGVYFFHTGTTGSCKFIEKNCRHWTISDAKDGDVLATTETRNCPFIYRKTDYNNNLAYYYAGVDGNGNFCEGCLKRTLYHFGPVANVAPATKEQRDLLFQKMKEAGYQWDAGKKELHKIIEPTFKVGDEIKTGNTIETIAEVDYATRSYCCESGRTIWFENQDLWHLAPKPHYNISNFKPYQKVLVRDYEDGVWNIDFFGFYRAENKYHFRCNSNAWCMCIPFDGNKHLLGTTDMCDECYINW